MWPTTNMIKNFTCLPFPKYSYVLYIFLFYNLYFVFIFIWHLLSQDWEDILQESLCAVWSLLCTTINGTPKKRFPCIQGKLWTEQLFHLGWLFDQLRANKYEDLDVELKMQTNSILYECINCQKDGHQSINPGFLQSSQRTIFFYQSGWAHNDSTKGNSWEWHQDWSFWACRK